MAQYRNRTAAFLVAASLVGCGQPEAMTCESVPKSDGFSEPGYVVDLVAGGSNACAMLDDDSLRCWGDNTYGQVGDGTQGVAVIPTQIHGLPSVEQVALGAAHVCARTASGVVWCWGDNFFHQLGVPDACPGQPVKVDGTGPVTDIAAKDLVSTALREDGTVLLWGELTPSIGAAAPELWVQGASYESIDVGRDFACALREDGHAECWGANDVGQLGVGDQADRDEPTQVVGLANIVKIVTGVDGACALLSNKSLWCWGGNAIGQLGDGTTMDQPEPHQVMVSEVEDVSYSSYHLCARVTNGHLWCWGDNRNWQILGGNELTGDDPPESIQVPMEVSGFEGVRDVAVGSDFTCALGGEHDVRCRGANREGQLGVGNIEFISGVVAVKWQETAP